MLDTNLKGKYVVVDSKFVNRHAPVSERLFFVRFGIVCDSVNTKVYGEWLFDSMPDTIYRSMIERLATESEVHDSLRSTAA